MKLWSNEAEFYNLYATIETVLKDESWLRDVLCEHLDAQQYELRCTQDHDASRQQLLEQSCSAQAAIWGLNDCQKSVLLKSIWSKLLLVQGPPGTGKTKMAAALVHAHCGAEAVVLMAAANKAIDNLILRVLEKAAALEAHKDLYRPSWGAFSIVGRCGQDIAPEVEPYELRALMKAAGFGKTYLKKHVRQKLRRFLQQNCMIHAGTCTAFAAVPDGQGVGYLDPAHSYALSVVEEAGQVTEPAAYAAFLANARCTVLVGDPAQLPPFVKSQEAKHCGHHISLLERLYHFVGIPFVLLTRQYRMHPDISQVSNRLIYGDRLQDASGTAMRVQIGGLPWQNRRHFIWYHVDGQELADGARGNARSFANEAEAVLCVSLAADILKSSPQVNVALLGMYDAQVALLNRHVQRRSATTSPRDLVVSTVDSFQGSERDVVIISLVRSNLENSVGFLKDPQRLNVAITRAKSLLVIVGNARHCYDADTSGFLTDLVEDVSRRGMLVSSETQQIVTHEDLFTHHASRPKRQMEPKGPMWRADSDQARASAEVGTLRMSELRSLVYAAEEVEGRAGSSADVVQQWDLTRFLELLDDFLTIKTVAVSLLQCGSVAFKASGDASASDLLREPWDKWVVKTWSYLHCFHGVNFTYDACNIPYALVMHCLAKRCGLLEGAEHEMCSTCAGKDILATAIATRTIPAVSVCLAYVVYRHSLPFFGTSVKSQEKLGDVLEAVGAMCDSTRARPRDFQAAMSENFGLQGLASASAVISDGHADDVWKISTHLFVHLCTHAVDMHKKTRKSVSYEVLLKSLLDRIPSRSTSSSAGCSLCHLVAQVSVAGQKQSGAAVVGAPPGLVASPDSAHGGNGDRRGAASSRGSDPRHRDRKLENAWDWQKSSGWDWKHDNWARSSRDVWLEKRDRRSSASGSWQTAEWASAWGEDTRPKRSWFEDSRSRSDDFVGSDAAKRARQVSPIVTLVPNLEGSEYNDDHRFAKIKTPDVTQRVPHRQYVCDSCKTVATRKSTRCPEYDGEFCNLEEIQEGQRGPGQLEEAWRGGWNATWWCTNCHILHRWNICAPYKESLKIKMRFELKILKEDVLNKLHANSKQYKSEAHSWSKLPKQYPIWARDENSS